MCRITRKEYVWLGLGMHFKTNSERPFQIYIFFSNVTENGPKMCLAVPKYLVSLKRPFS